MRGRGETKRPKTMKAKPSLATATGPKTMAGRLRSACAARFLLLFLLTLSAVVQAQYDTTTTNGTITITKYTGSAFAVDIPSTINGLPVTRIGDGAFFDCTNLTSVFIPNTVISIGSGAFGGCSHLTAITVNPLNSAYSSVDGILFNQSQTTLIQYPGGKAGSYTIPNSVTSIGDSAFYGCTGLTAITIPNGVTNIDGSAFSGCTSLTSVTIPNSVTSIGDFVLADSSSLTSVTIPSSVTSIGDFAFYKCTSLSAVTVDAQNSAYSSADGVLFNRNQTLLIQYPGGKAGSYVIPNSVTKIEDYGFALCGSLTSVTIPNSVTSIGEAAFYGCSSLTSVTIPNSVTSIGNGTFLLCSSLTSITIPNSVTSIRDRAFEECTSLTSIAIPNSVTNIGWGAFFSCTSLTNVTIGNSVTKIEDYAFALCGSLTSVTIPNSVTSIGEAAFLLCSSLTSITIPNSVTSIRDRAFEECTKLSSITIPDSVTSIGDTAFYDCSSLTSATIPNSVTNIGDYAFDGCTNLTSLTMDMTTVGSDFSGIKKLRNLIIGEHVKTIGDGAFYGCTNLTSVTIPDGVTSIGGGAFQGCSSLTSVMIPNSVTSIGDYAFFSCTSLTGIYFQGNAPSIGSAVFSWDNNATVYYMPGTTGWGTTFGGRPTALWIPLQVQVSAGANGSISPSTTQMAISGGSVSFTANPNAGYLVDQWLVDGAVVKTGGNSYTLSNIQTNRSVHVTFTYDPMIPTPVITALQPEQVKPGGPLFILNVNGFNFMAGSVIRWNGNNQTTTFGNSNSLMTIIMNTLIASPGTVSITVVNPGPNGGVRSAESWLTIADTATNPKMTLARAGNIITIVWPTNGFTLQSSPVLPATNWQNVAGSEITNSVRVTIGTGKQFYRLKQ